MPALAMPQPRAFSPGATPQTGPPPSRTVPAHAHSPPSHLGHRLLLQRCGGSRCAPGTCNHEDDLRLARSPGPDADARVGGAGAEVAPRVVHDVLRSSGQPLGANVLALMDRNLGGSFATVRVHTDSRAQASARAVDARAYTVGGHVVFGPGEYRPDSSPGRRLLAHELVHVMQQGGGDPSAQQELAIGAVDAPSEREADAVAAGLRPPPAGRGGALSVARTVFTPGDNHGHTPSGRWADVQAAPNSGILESLACSTMPPMGVVGAAIASEFRGKPIALMHLMWYLAAGGGADFVEDSNLDSMLRKDSGVQGMLHARIPTGRTTGTDTGHFKIEQSDYSDQDFRFAFGAIDRLDYEVDFAAGTLHAWFQDRYEWHPFYPFYTALAGDAARSTNCVHAAMVELKSGSASDFWMKGEATVPLSVIRPAPWWSLGGIL